MNGQLQLLAVSAMALVAATSVGVAGGIGPPVLELVVLGDSFTSTLDLDHWRDDPSLSWATGAGLPQPSISERLEEQGWHVRATNLATSGHRVRDLHEQLAEAPASADLVVLWIGINDLCAPGADATTFRADIRAALGAVEMKYPRAQVLVFAPPDLAAIGSQHQVLPDAHDLWKKAAICPLFLGDQYSKVAAERRQASFETLLRTSSNEHGFSYSTALVSVDRPVSQWTGWDYLHPSPKGSAWFADRSWPAVMELVGPGPGGA